MAEEVNEESKQKIECALNELTERKNDERKPLLKKRPSPNSQESKRRSHHGGQQPAQSFTDKFTRRQTAFRRTPPLSAKMSIDITDSDDTNDDDDDDDNDEDTENEVPNGYPMLAKVRKTSPETSATTEPSSTSSPPSMQINPFFLENSFSQRFKKSWREIDESTGDGSTAKPKLDEELVSLHSEPFKICVMQNFIENKPFVQQLIDEMCYMEWQRKQMDLYEFHQTTDLANVSPETRPALRKFYETLNDVMLPWMREISGLDLSYVSASCSMYNYGDFLLIHDDLLSDRQIAFVYYVTPWEDAENWSDDMGGALELFGCDPLTGQPKYPVAKKLPPRNSQFIFFRVCDKSFHQVGEVTNLVYPRLSINGWFHGQSSSTSTQIAQAESSNKSIEVAAASNSSDATASALETVNNTLPQTYLNYQSPIRDDIDLSEWIFGTYLESSVKSSIQLHIESKSEVSLERFLIREFYDLLLAEFRDNSDLEWVVEGPANQRKYETLRLPPNSNGPPKDLQTLFTSKSMFSLLQQYTELDFDGPNAVRPQCSVQICRFTQGCYTLLGDSSTFTENALDIVLFFNAKNNVGTVTYLSPVCLTDEPSISLEVDTTASSGLSEGESHRANRSAAAAKTSKAKKPTRLSTSTAGRANGASDSSRKGNKSSTAAVASAGTATSGEETGADQSSIGFDPLDDVEIMSILNEIELTKRNSRRQRRRTEGSSDDDFEHDEDAIDEVDDEFSDQDVEDGEGDDEDDADGEKSADYLQHEEVLLTIHPKDNAVNLVYRTAGQAKFVKYVSKNAIKPDEYVYVLFATYKE